MGFLKDMKGLKQTADAMTPPEHKGVMGGFRAIKDTAAMGNQMLGDMAAQQQKSQRLMAVGRVGQGTITSMRDTGVTVNNDPEVEFELQIALDGQAPYAATVKQTISRIVIGNFQPGAGVPVRVDPEDPASVMIA